MLKMNETVPVNSFRERLDETVGRKNVGFFPRSKWVKGSRLHISSVQESKPSRIFVVQTEEDMGGS
jgi:hypothetical protein